jgi:adenylate cyclase
MNAARRYLASPSSAGVAVATVVFLGILALSRTGYLETLELGAYDWLIRLRPASSPPTQRIMLITISERDIRDLGQWPVSDHALAQALAQLAGQQPRAIGLDIYRDIPVPPGREELNAVLAEHSHIITVMKFGDGGESGISPPPVLRDTEQVGFSDVLADPGGTVRRGLLFLDQAGTTAYSFALRLALLYLHAEGIGPQPDATNPGHLRLGSTTLPPFEADNGGYVRADSRGYQFLLDFREPPDAFPRYSLTQLLSGKVDLGAVKDKVVLIGVSAESVKDFFYTPLSRGLHLDQEVPGVVLHALITSQLLRMALDDYRPIATPGEWQEAAWILLWSILGSIVGRRGRSPLGFALFLTSGFLVLSSIVYIAFLWSWWLLLIAPGLAWALSASLSMAYWMNQERRQRALLMSLFARHVAPEIAEEIWQHRDQFLASGRPRPQKMTATVMFTDVQGFTAIAEKLEPDVLINWLNEYLERITPLVHAHGGVVIRFIGDAIMAVFGVPVCRHTEVEIRQDAVNAVECALAMERELVQLNARWRSRQWPTIGMRIGIYTGPVVTGSVGNRERMEYNIHGDTANIASRLESFDKDHFAPDFLNRPCRIFIGGTTLALLDGRFQTEQVGLAQLRGKDQAVTIFQVFNQTGGRARIVQ